MDLIIAGCVGALIGAIIGPPIGLWSLRLEHAIERHRSQCGACQSRAERRTVRRAG